MDTGANVDPNQMLTTDEAALLLGLKSATLANWREDGSADLAFSKFGRSVRYRYGDVIAFVERSRARSTLEARGLKSKAVAPPATPQTKRKSNGVGSGARQLSLL